MGMAILNVYCSNVFLYKCENDMCAIGIVSWIDLSPINYVNWIEIVLIAMPVNKLARFWIEAAILFTYVHL